MYGRSDIYGRQEVARSRGSGFPDLNIMITKAYFHCWVPIIGTLCVLYSVYFD